MKLIWKVTIGLSAVLVLALAIIITKAVSKKKKEKNKKAALAACQKKKKDETVFVMLVTYKDPFGAAQTLLNIFQRAECPLRIHVGLYEYYDPDDDLPAIKRYEALVSTSTAAFSMHDHIRILRAPVADFKNSAIAREQIQKFLFRNETFVLCISQPSDFIQKWDSYCIDVFAGLKSEKAILSCIPEFTNRRPAQTEPGTFVATGNFMKTYPRLLAYRMKHTNNTNIPVPALGWSPAFSFGKGKIPYPSREELPSLAEGEDIQMTQRFLDLEMKIFHPARQVACSFAHPNMPDALPDIHRGPNTKALSRFGAEPSSRTVTARGRLGLLPHPNKKNEIESKVGTVGDYLSILSRLETSSLAAS